MSRASYIVADVRAGLDAIEDDSVDLVLSSPGFLGLRAYLPAGHPLKHLEVGTESTPAAYIDSMLDITARLRAKLTRTGTMAIELGDTFAGSGGGGGDLLEGGRHEGRDLHAGEGADGRAANAAHWRQKNGGDKAPRQTRVGRGGKDRRADEAAGIRPRQNGTKAHVPGWPLDKSLALIPELYRVALAYNINPLTGAPSPAGDWRVRNVVRWCRPNPSVGALGDKVRPATSDMAIACTARDRWFDLDAVRAPAAAVKDQLQRSTNGPRDDADPNEVLGAGFTERVPSNPAGAPPLDHLWVDDEDDVDIAGAPDDLERARRWWCRSTQGFGQSATRQTGWSISTAQRTPRMHQLTGRLDRFADLAERLRLVFIENRDALEIIARYGADPDAVLYVDPPYLRSTRTAPTCYEHEFQEDHQHRALAAALRACEATVVLSGYASALYDDELYPDWHRDQRVVTMRAGNGRNLKAGDVVEVLWINRPPTDRLHLA